MSTSIPTITSLGVGSGLDLNTIVTKLVSLERQPLVQMQADAGNLQTEVSSFGQISSLLSGLQTASNALTDPPLWSRSAVTSADPGSVSVSSASGVASGNYSVAVQSLASGQTLASGTVFPNADALVGSGTLSLQLGSWDAQQTSFTPQNGSSSVDIAVTNTDTLQTLRDKINSAGMGVTASLVTDATGVRLSLNSSATGAANGFRVIANGGANNSPASGLGLLAFDPPAGATAMQLMQGSADAKATVNGIAVVSASNALSGVVDGLTLNLSKVTTAPVTVTATPDRTSVGNAIQAFATAYNALASYMADQTKYDATSKVAGPLQGDSAATTLQQKLRTLLGSSSGASSVFGHLSDIGLQVQRDGTLSVDQTKLDAATSNLPELKKAFANSDPADSSNDGFARRYADLTTQMLGVDGIVATRTAGLQALLTKNSNDQAALNDHVDAFQARLVAQYTALDTQVAQLNALSSYVTQQITNWNQAKA